ncbi:hypothetical protein Trydic_g17910 [Trypoxylus dichotomus]
MRKQTHCKGGRLEENIAGVSGAVVENPKNINSSIFSVNKQLKNHLSYKMKDKDCTRIFLYSSLRRGIFSTRWTHRQSKLPYLGLRKSTKTIGKPLNLQNYLLDELGNKDVGNILILDSIPNDSREDTGENVGALEKKRRKMPSLEADMMQSILLLKHGTKSKQLSENHLKKN